MDGFLKKVFASCLALGASAALAWGQDKLPAGDVQALRELIQQQQKQIDELSQRVNNAVSVPQPVQAPGGEMIGAPKDVKAEPAPVKLLDTKDVQQIVADYLRDNPGKGMPSGVQTGYSMGTGFYIKSPPNPAYSNWSDQSAV